MPSRRTDVLGCCSRNRPTASPGHPVPGPKRPAGRRAIRRDDRRPVPSRAPTTSSSGRQSALRARQARRATTCGVSPRAGSLTSRPGSVVARSATSAHGTSCSIRSGARPTRWPNAGAFGGHAGGAGSRAVAAPRHLGRPIERPRRDGRRACRLGRADRRSARRTRLPVARLGRGAPGARVGRPGSWSPTTADASLPSPGPGLRSVAGAPTCRAARFPRAWGKRAT